MKQVLHSELFNASQAASKIPAVATEFLLEANREQE